MTKTDEQRNHENSITVGSDEIPKKAVRVHHGVKKAIVLGSGALKIGEAGEFDYSGSQAIKALKEENINTILVNPNIATIQTSEHIADKIYFLPVNPYFVEKIIEKEKPDAILLAFGGQTALNCGLALHDSGVLKKYDVRVLGTQVETIRTTEDRDLFVKSLSKINAKTPLSKAVETVEEACKAANIIGYPVMMRSAFSLGGMGSGVVQNEDELKDLASKAFSKVGQILVEEYLGGWKEIEYEVVRDASDNCITVCNMENFDPMGIHTGESIVVAPSQTLSNSEYHKLRSIATKVIRHLGIVGECNIQYALSPNSEDYRIIEVNARLSRSSALASKATGYPLAFIAAKLGLGYSLYELENSITKKTKCCFEPSLDYIVVKVPRWDLQKFRQVKKQIGSEMKSVGEVMAIGRKFEETIQKALRMLQIGYNGLVCNDGIDFKDLSEELKNPTDKRILAVVRALRNGKTIDEIHEMTGIDRWFMYKIQNVLDIEKKLKKGNIDTDLLLEAKQLGYSDKQIGLLTGKSETHVRESRKKHNIFPFVKQIDTLGAEYPAQTNYLYMTYNGTEHDIELSGVQTNISRNAKLSNESNTADTGSNTKSNIKSNTESVIVLGSGAYMIGSSVEFDWCCVNSVLTANKLGYKTILINYNPETVSTDYDTCDRLYFEELSLERVMDIYELEQPKGLIVSMGGQVPNNLAMPLHTAGFKILGTCPTSIDNAENRHRFSALLDELEIDQPEWEELTSVKDAIKFAKNIQYPVLIRPSYVLSGAAMNVVFDDVALEKYIKKASDVSPEHPVLISKFIENCKEIEMDAVACKGELKVWAITEHIENAGVHSGDATVVLPAQKLYVETIRKVKECTKKIARNLNISGPFNIQFLAKDNHIKVIELNLRASRSFPFCSKVMKINFIDIATKVILGQETEKINGTCLDLDYVGVKAPQFSFSRLKGVDPVLGVEMASTGEVACFGNSVEEAFLKSLISTGFTLPKKNILVSISGDNNRYKILGAVKKLVKKGYKIYATSSTGKFLNENGVDADILHKIHEKKEPNVLTFLLEKKLDMVISMPDDTKPQTINDTSYIRRLAIDFNIPLINNTQLTRLFADAVQIHDLDSLEIKSWDEYHQDD
ncbi:carbamoyl-phosphate synthase large subunit [Candidatus Woesearchaeota archaeon]|nr:carbamoyl-phosphate synthase large subunit [Candidatus Woesearchaeota archaeon]